MTVALYLRQLLHSRVQVQRQQSFRNRLYGGLEYLRLLDQLHLAPNVHSYGYGFLQLRLWIPIRTPKDMSVVRSTREGIRIFQLPAPEKEAKIYERQGLIAAVVIALITTFGFAFTILQANLSDQNRLLGYSIVLVALLALFFGVWYGPLKEYQSKLRIRRLADR